MVLEQDDADRPGSRAGGNCQEGQREYEPVVPFGLGDLLGTYVLKLPTKEKRDDYRYCSNVRAILENEDAWQARNDCVWCDAELYEQSKNQHQAAKCVDNRQGGRGESGPLAHRHPHGSGRKRGRWRLSAWLIKGVGLDECHGTPRVSTCRDSQVISIR